MRLTESSLDVLQSFTDNGGDWAEACSWLTDVAWDCAKADDPEGFTVNLDMASEISAWAKSRNKI